MRHQGIPWLGLALAVGAAVVLGLSLVLYRDLRRTERLSMRLRMVQPGAAAPASHIEAELAAPLRIVTAIGEAIARSGALSTKTLEELRQTLHIAGFRGRHGLGLFVGTKLLLVVGLPLATLALPWLAHRELPFPPALLAIATGTGLLAPDKVVQSLRKRYLRALESGIPDALDMMVICGQAGLGLEASIERVGVEIRYAHLAVAEELTQTAHEMQVNADTRTPLLNLGRRTGLESVRRLAGVLIQSIQYGTPLTQALRSLSAEQRQEMLVKFEGRAARLPVLLTIPMIVFILPCVFLIVAGPAMVDVYPDDDEMIIRAIMNRKAPVMVWVNACFRCGLALLLIGCSAGGARDAGGGVPAVNIADAAMDGGMPQAALNVTSSILQSDPRNVGALARQGAALAQLNQPDAAMEAYRRALAVDPSAPAALLGLGRLELSRGSPADAEHSFSKLLQSAPNDRTALNDLGVALDLQGRHAAAQLVYAKLLRIDPGNRAAAVNQALSLSLSGQAERSVALLRGPAARADASPRVRQDLAVALTLSGNRREAEKLLLDDLSPSDAAAALAGYQALTEPEK